MLGLYSRTSRVRGARVLFTFASVALLVTACGKDSAKAPETAPQIIQMVYTSDMHFGVTRAAFRGATAVDAQVVNAAMVAKINTLASVTLPSDTGVAAGQTMGGVDIIINTGGISNREEPPVPSAATTWAQYQATVTNGVTVKSRGGQAPIWLLAPGNHEVSNAIGFYKTMAPLTDATTIAGIYNAMMNPSVAKTAASYNYATDKVHYSRDIGGVHFAFVNLWPDSSERAWLDNDLKTAVASAPILLFTHDQPAVETKHLGNPNGAHDVNATDKFENMVVEWSKDGSTVSATSNSVQRGLDSYLKSHPAIKAYFHGNDNQSEYYVYRGPDNDVNLNVFRVDSPMKGNISATDETKLSFLVLSLNVKTKQLTVREALWNGTPSNPSAPITWGFSKTIALSN